MTTVLVTGDRGYIGSVLVPHLLEEGYDVVGLDTGYFDECTLVQDGADVRTIRRDLRDVRSEDLHGVDAVVHLGALSNDPIGNLNSRWTEEINHRASVRLAELAKQAGVGRFVFSSSCIMYGMSEADVVDETAPLDPQTDYARSKVDCERSIATLADGSFSPTFLRNGTVYGLSPRMRFDTVLNDLVGSAFTSRKIVVHGDGTPWRPVVHVQDLARAFRTVLEAPLRSVNGEAFNTGADDLNRRVLDLAEAAAGAVPGCEIELLRRPSADRRTYRASFAKWRKTFPEFEFRWSPSEGARELAERFEEISLTAEAYRDARFTRLRWLSHLLESSRLDQSLRWATAVAA